MSKTDSKDSGTVMLACLGVIVAIPLTWAVAYVIEGWVLIALWDWFVAPHGLPALTLPHAIGVSVIAGMLTHQTQIEPKGETASERWGRVLGALTIRPACFLLIGYVAHLFIGG